MEEQTGKLLKECSSGCKMAINSLNQVRDFVKDEKLHQLLDEYDKKHKALEEDISWKNMENKKRILILPQLHFPGLQRM